MSEISHAGRPIEDPQAISMVVDLEGDNVLVDVVRPPRKYADVEAELKEKYPGRVITMHFGIDILTVAEPDDEAHIVRGEN